VARYSTLSDAWAHIDAQYLIYWLYTMRSTRRSECEVLQSKALNFCSDHGVTRKAAKALAAQLIRVVYPTWHSAINEEASEVKELREVLRARHESENRKRIAQERARENERCQTSTGSSQATASDSANY
jgi:hypothetical protein